MRMSKMGKLVLRYRFQLCVLTGILTVFFAFGLERAKVESDVVKWLEQDDPAVRLFDYIGKNYGGTSLALVAVETDDVFSPQTLRLIRDLTETFSNLQGISSVTSLTNILDIRKTDEGLEVTKLIDKDDLPEDTSELRKLKEYTLSRDLYRGKIVSADGRITLITIMLQNGADKTYLARKIREVAEDAKSRYPGEVRLYYGGIPMQMEEVNDMVLDDMKKLIPFVSLVVIVVLFLGFHTVRGILLPLLVVILSSVWSLGLMGWLNVPLSIVSNIMPVLLIAIGTAYGIHFISRYREEIQSGKSSFDSVKGAFGEVGAPIVLAGLTTLSGFLSFTGSYLKPITHFGMFTAFGVAAAVFLSLTLIPAILSWLKPPRSRYKALQTGARSFGNALKQLESFVIQHEKVILSLGIVILLFALFGVKNITTSVNLAEYFPENSMIRKSSELLREHFGGDLPIQMLIKGDLKDPVVLHEMLRFEKFLRTVPGVHNPQSLADLIAEMNDVMNDRKTVPETPEGVSNLLFMLEGEDILSQLVNSNYSEGVIQARFSEIATDRILNAHREVENYINGGGFTNKYILVENWRAKDEKGEIAHYLASKVGEEITWDVRYYSGKPDWSLEGLADSLISFLEAPVTLDGDQLEKARLRFVNYFEEESDVILPDREIEALSRELSLALKNAKVDTSSLRRILMRYIPRHLLEEDPELLDFTLESVQSIADEETKEAEAEKIQKKLMSLLPEETLNNSDFRKELKGDIWKLLEGRVALPEKLAGSILEAPEDSIRVMDVKHSGLLPIYTKIHKNLLKSQIQSLILAFIIVTVLVALQLGSPIAGVLSTSPILLVVALNFGLMGLLGIPLDNATMMIASIAIGIGVDYSIHFVSRFKNELRKSQKEAIALHRTLETTGRAILLNAFTVGLGFLVLIFAALVPIRRFGWMIAFTMGTSALFAITFLPALILIWSKFFRNGKKNSKGGMYDEK
ncbi:MAG TPA: RND family transporter [candidate division WOR-3 bacterium]|uniref:RND family transporter n=1 Tax=candidate division WOR-3 bacterium TaxID=2052148 RepID=A0A7C0XBD0_UNCW3|nr:RND family transporter [candidate division WOR-3 bacterium]